PGSRFRVNRLKPRACETMKFLSPTDSGGPSHTNAGYSAMTDNTDRKRRRRIAAAIIAGAATLGVVGASAASLGGITSNSLGADTAVVGSCDLDGVTLAYTNSYDATLGRYQTTAVNVTGIA